MDKSGVGMIDDKIQSNEGAGEVKVKLRFLAASAGIAEVAKRY